MDAPNDVLDAFRLTVKSYPGGAVALAARLGMSPDVLRNKADRKKTSNKPLLEDADNVMEITGDYRVLDSLAQSHGGVFLRIDVDTPASDLAVLELVTHVWRAGGDVGKAVDESLADGRVTRDELAAIDKAIYEQIRTLKALRKRMEGMAE